MEFGSVRRRRRSGRSKRGMIDGKRGNKGGVSLVGGKERGDSSGGKDHHCASVTLVIILTLYYYSTNLNCQISKYVLLQVKADGRGMSLQPNIWKILSVKPFPTW